MTESPDRIRQRKGFLDRLKALQEEADSLAEEIGAQNALRSIHVVRTDRALVTIGRNTVENGLLLMARALFLPDDMPD